MDPKLTAYAIARVRAEEGALPEGSRLFTDPYGHLFDDPQADIDPLFEGIPFFREHIRLRTRFIDDLIRAELSAGVRHLVLVGAGFDCRSLRMPEIAAQGAAVIEVDHVDQLRSKRERLGGAGVEIPAFVHFAGVDLAEESLEESLPRALRGAGLPQGARVLFVCEGLVGYLSPPAVGRLFAATGGLAAPGSVLVANHSTVAWPASQLRALLESGGWSPHDAPTFAELHQRWIGGAVPGGSELFAFAVARK